MSGLVAAHSTPPGARVQALAIRRDVSSAVSLLRGLSDEQVSRSSTVFADALPLASEQFIQRILIGHAVGHLESMSAAL